MLSLHSRAQITIAAFVLACTGCQQVSLLSSATTAFNAPTQEQPVQQPGPFAAKGLSVQKSAEACLATARELEGGGYDKEAIVVYERALSFDSKQTGLAFPLARLHAKLGSKDRAMHYFKASLTERPNDPDILGDYGYFLFEEGDIAGAEQQLRHALNAQPKNLRNRTNLALVLYHGNRIKESLRVFEEAAGRPAARFNLAVLLARDGRSNESRQFIHEALMLDPQMPEALALQEWLNGNGTTPAPGRLSAGTATVSLNP